MSFFLVTKCEIHEHPETGSLTQGYNPSATFYIQFVTCESQKKMEPNRCYACADLLFIASVQEPRAYEQECCGIFLYHNCVDLQQLKSKCVSCDECRNGLLLKTLAVTDLVVIDGQAAYDLHHLVKSRLLDSEAEVVRINQSQCTFF